MMMFPVAQKCYKHHPLPFKVKFIWLISTSDHSSSVLSLIISTTSNDSQHQKPAPFISVPSNDNGSKTSGLTPSSNTLSFQSSPTPHDQINYDVFKSKYDSFHKIFNAKNKQQRLSIIKQIHHLT